MRYYTSEQIMDFLDLLKQNLKNLFDIKEQVNGKVDLQKSFYFMKEIGLIIPFNFRWSKLGPYSYELDNVIERLTNQGYLLYNSKYELYDKAFKNIEPNYPTKLATFFDDLNDTCSSKLDYNEVYFIECAASLHFIYKYSNIRKKDASFKKLEELKPDRIEILKPYMNDAWIFLSRQKLIT